MSFWNRVDSKSTTVSYKLLTAPLMKKKNPADATLFLSKI